jgi:nitrogen fixation NifU-like protein
MKQGVRIMSETGPYDDVMMDHIRNARNYFVPNIVSHKATGSNPLCGDDITVYLRIVCDRIQDIAFQCACCGISMASASIMTEMIKGKNTTDARSLLRAFVTLLNSPNAPSLPAAAHEQHAILETVQKFPSRIRCAVLPWSTLEGAMDNPQEAVFVR